MSGVNSCMKRNKFGLDDKSTKGAIFHTGQKCSWEEYDILVG